MFKKRNFLTAVLLPITLLVLAVVWTNAPPMREMSKSVTPATIPATIPAVMPANKPELIVFSATWCGACQRIKDQINQIEKTGIKVTRFDADQNPNILAKYNITSLPTMLFKVGNKVSRTQNIDELMRWIKEAKCATA